MEQFIASLLGALVGGIIALIGVYFSHKLQRSQQQAQEQKLLRGFLQAIKTELEICWSRAEETVNLAIENLPENQPFESETFINTDYFTVYHNNSHLLGRVNDDNLRQMIVSTYTRYKALVETYNVNTQYILKWKESGDDYYRQKALGWAVALKNDHYKLKPKIEELIVDLEKTLKNTIVT